MKDELIVAVISMLISLITLLITFPIWRRQVSAKLHIHAFVSDDKEKIHVHLANISYERKITIVGFEIYYGVNKDLKQLVFKAEIESKTLDESEAHNFSLEAKTLKQRTLKVNQEYYHQLIIRILTSGKRSSYSSIDISDNYFVGKQKTVATKFLAADDLMGFKPMEPKDFSPSFRKVI